MTANLREPRPELCGVECLLALVCFAAFVGYVSPHDPHYFSSRRSRQSGKHPLRLSRDSMLPYPFLVWAPFGLCHLCFALLLCFAASLGLPRPLPYPYPRALSACPHPRKDHIQSVIALFNLAFGPFFLFLFLAILLIIIIILSPSAAPSSPRLVSARTLANSPPFPSAAHPFTPRHSQQDDHRSPQPRSLPLGQADASRPRH